MPATDEDANLEDRFITRRETQQILQDDQERFVSRREAEQWRASIQALIDTLVSTHQNQHAAEAQAVELQLKHHEMTREEHETAHFRDHLAHEKIHGNEQDSITKALEATQVLAKAHDKAHEREHEAHTREHSLDKLAIDKAERANDLRFAAEGNTLDALRKEYDRRMAEANASDARGYEENRKRIEALEKGDVKSEGKSAGLSVAWAVTLGAIGAIGGVLAIFFTLTRQP